MYNPNPNFIDLSVSGKFTVGGGSNAPATFVRNSFQVADDIDIIRGAHHHHLRRRVHRYADG